MERINNLVHYIWVGNNPIPKDYINNFNVTRESNKHYKFILWRDSDVVSNITHIEKEYNKGSIFQKLQLARYSVMNLYGGFYSDFDIVWKVGIDAVYSALPKNTELCFPKRNSLYFYDKGKKTTLVDDFVIVSKPGITGNFLDYCKKTAGTRDSFNPKTDPYSVYALTEWILTQKSEFFTHEQIGMKHENPIFGVHDNNQTWSS